MAIEKYSNSLPTIRADCDEWTEYLGVNPSPKVLDQVGLSAAVWKAIRKGLRPRVPVACYRLARFHRYFDLVEVLGAAWAGFSIAGDALVFPGLKYPLQAAELRGLWLKCQRLGSLQSEVRLLQHDVAQLEAENAGLVSALASPRAIPAKHHA